VVGDLIVKMNKLKALVWSASGLLMVMSGPANAADTTAMMMSAEAAAQGANASDTVTTSASATTESGSGSRPSGSSRAALFDSAFGHTLPFSVTDFTMILGPGLNNMSASAPTAAQPYSGVSARHELRLDYLLRPNVTISPTMDASEYFYTAKQGRLTLNDPSLRVAISDISHARFGDSTFDGSVWLSVYAPTSAMSQALNEYTAASVAYIPKLHFRGSRFFLSGVAEGKVNFMQNSSQTGLIAPLQLVSAVQGNYRASPKVTCFLMNHVNSSIGPNMQQLVSATGIAADNFRRKAQAQNAVTDGFMLGAMFQVVQGISVSPRLDWTINNPIGTTSVGVNASFHII
jgi:hypothetical protein